MPTLYETDPSGDLSAAPPPLDPTQPAATNTPEIVDQWFNADGTFKGDYRGYFDSLFPGSTLTGVELKAKEAELGKAGIKVVTGASGNTAWINYPGSGGDIDVIGDYGTGNTKQWLLPGTGGTDSGAGDTTFGGGVDESYLKPFELSFGEFDPAYVDKTRLDMPPEFSFDPFTAPTGESIQQDPSFKFRTDTARGMLENSAAGKGLINTGGTLYDILNLGQDMASSEYGNIWNRDFNLWGAKNQNKLNAYGTNYGVTTDAYGRAQDQYKDLRNTFYQNQSNPFSKLFQVAGLGANSAAVA
ncbi:MAG: hypothetical protein Q7R41_17850 [Phycisphaerales bacterium]|nr:hypothetical protein [Phycisphaerales bacterium]